MNKENSTNPPDPASAPNRGGIRSKDSYAGFTVVEVMLAVVIIGILAAIAIPSFQRIRQQANVSRFVNDLRTMSGQFEGYHFSNARWPADTPAGQLPSGVEGYVSEGSFTQTNAVGSAWKWVNNNSVIGIGVEYGGSQQEDVLYMAIAERIDDNNLFSGRFQAIGSDSLVWILEGTP